MISEPGAAKTLAWPGGAGVAHLDSPLGTKFYALKQKNGQTHKHRKKSGRTKIIKTENIGKKELAAPPYHRINNCFLMFLSSGHKVLCLKIEK